MPKHIQVRRPLERALYYFVLRQGFEHNTTQVYYGRFSCERSSRREAKNSQRVLTIKVVMGKHRRHIDFSDCDGITACEVTVSLYVYISIATTA